jgi:hypothetical protein
MSAESERFFKPGHPFREYLDDVQKRQERAPARFFCPECGVGDRAYKAGHTCVYGCQDVKVVERVPLLVERMADER